MPTYKTHQQQQQRLCPHIHSPLHPRLLQNPPRLSQPAPENIIRDLDPQRHAPQRERLPRPIRSPPPRLVPDRIGRLVRDRAILLQLLALHDVRGGEGIETPVHAQVHAADAVVEHGVPEAGEALGHVGAHGAELVRDGEGGVVGLAEEIAVDAVELVARGREGDGVGLVGGEGQAVALLVVQADGLEEGAAEGGVPGGVGREGRLERDVVGVGVRGALGEPEGVHEGVDGGVVLAHAGEGPPDLEGVFGEPGEDAGVGLGGVGEGEEAHEAGGVGLVGQVAGGHALDREAAQDLVVVAGRGADQVGAVVGPEEAGRGLVGAAGGGVEGLGAALPVDFLEGEVVRGDFVGGGAGGGVADEVLFLDGDASGQHAVEGGGVHADGALGPVGVVDVDGDDADGVGGVVVELETAGCGLVVALVEGPWALVKQVQHGSADGLAERVAGREGVDAAGQVSCRFVDEVAEDGCGDNGDAGSSGGVELTENRDRCAGNGKTGIAIDRSGRQPGVLGAIGGQVRLDVAQSLGADAEEGVVDGEVHDT